MFWTLVLLIVIFGGSGYWVKGQYEGLEAKVKQVQLNRQKLDKSVSERHQIVQALLQAKDEKDLFNEYLDALPNLKKRIREARDLDEENKLIKAEEELTVTLDALQTFMDGQADEDLKKLASNMKALNGKYKATKENYNESVDAYGDEGEVFINSIMIAVFEKQLCHNFPIWELSEEGGDDFSDDDL